MLLRYIDGVVAWARHRLTNAALEGNNSRVRAISQRAHGYRNPNNLMLVLYHACVLAVARGGIPKSAKGAFVVRVWPTGVAGNGPQSGLRRVHPKSRGAFNDYDWGLHWDRTSPSSRSLLMRGARGSVAGQPSAARPHRPAARYSPGNRQQ
jgi:transposase